MGNGPHCLYAHAYDSVKNIVLCKNSHGPNNKPFPSIKIGDVMNFYRVSASAVKLTLQKANNVQQTTSQHPNSAMSSTSPQQAKVSIYEIEEKCESWICDSPSLSELLEAARLISSRSTVTNLQNLKLKNINIDQIPTQQLITLVSRVTDEVFIMNVQGNLTNVIRSARCENLHFKNITLDTYQTMLVLEALQNRIKFLYIGPDVTLDFEILQNYDGLGKCRWMGVFCSSSTSHKYKSKLEKFGKRLEWQTDRIEVEAGYWARIKRPVPMIILKYNV